LVLKYDDQLKYLVLTLLENRLYNRQNNDGKYDINRDPFLKLMMTVSQDIMIIIVQKKVQTGCQKICI